MKKLLCILLSCFLLAGCAPSEEVPAPKADASSPFGITASVSDITPTGLTLTLAQKGGHVTGTLQTGLDFQLERLEGEEWKAVGYIGEAVFSAIAKIIAMNSTTVFSLGWSHFYGKLPAGHYRIVKSIMDFRSPGDFDTLDVYAEFDI